MNESLVKRIAASIYTRYILGGVIGIQLGVLLGALRNVRVEPSISVDGILKSLVTIITSFIVVYVVQRILKTDEREKDFLCEQLNELAESSRCLEDLGKGKALTEVTAALKHISVTANIMRDFVSGLNRASLPVTEFDFLKDVGELRLLATETPPDKIIQAAKKRNSEIPAAVKNGIIQLAKQREEQLERVYRSFALGS